ncbi:hypothetical protein TWF751_001979 [Orbilia oligospora]|nr:hypothetical protein TWF751_001979 [Orbilia oligospora]
MEFFYPNTPDLKQDLAPSGNMILSALENQRNTSPLPQARHSAISTIQLASSRSHSRQTHAQIPVDTTIAISSFPKGWFLYISATGSKKGKIRRHKAFKYTSPYNVVISL